MKFDGTVNQASAAAGSRHKLAAAEAWSVQQLEQPEKRGLSGAQQQRGLSEAQSVQQKKKRLVKEQ